MHRQALAFIDGVRWRGIGLFAAVLGVWAMSKSPMRAFGRIRDCDGPRAGVRRIDRSGPAAA